MLSSSSDARAIYAKLGVKNQAEAVAWFKENCSEAELEAQNDRQRPEAATTQVTVPMSVEPDLSSPKPPPWTFISAFSVMSLCLLILILVPPMARGGLDIVDEILLNLYALIPAVAGVYGISHFGVQSRFLRVFKIFSLGLVFWALGGAIWTVYDLFVGLEPHYPSWSDLGYFSQTVLQVVSFGWWWVIVAKRGHVNRLAWLPITIALFIPYYLALATIGQMENATPVDMSRLSLDFMNTVGDTLSAALAICLILPASLRLYTQRTKIAMSIVAAGMLMFFVVGALYMISLSVPDNHFFFYPAGGWIDVAFGMVMLIWGLGIAVASTANVAFQDEE